MRYQSAFEGLEEMPVYIGPIVLARFDAGYLGLACSVRLADEDLFLFGAQQF